MPQDFVPAKDLSPEQLRQMAEAHVAYELISMAWWTRHQPDDDIHLAQATSESYLLHVRCLREFLTTAVEGLRRKDLLVAEHYFADGWSRRPDPAAVLGSEVLDIHRRVAHVSTQRLTRSPSPVDTWAGHRSLVRWAEMILDAFGMFVDDLRAENAERAGWFDDGYAEARRTLAS